MNSNLVTSDRVSWALVLSACVLQIVLGSAVAATHLPLCDEGFYGVPAHVLSVTGALKNPVMESSGIFYLRGIDRVFYWMAPAGLVMQAAAFKMFGFGLFVQRGLTVACGLGAIIFWYLALRKLVAERVAALAALLLSVDFVFHSIASLGRSDVISLFFAMAALAAYMQWRERSLVLALVVSNTACALSGMVHPNGGIAALVSLAVLIFYLDRTRLRWSHLGVVAVSYGVPALVWGFYIAKAPSLFVAQFFGNVAIRFGGPPAGRAGPLTFTQMLTGEVTRYVSAYELENVHGIRLLRGLLPLSYLFAVLYCPINKDVRRQTKVLLLMFFAVWLTLVFLEGAKQGWYLVHLSPLYCAFLAISWDRLWASGRIVARTIVAAQAAIVLLGVASLVVSASNRNLQRLYQPTVNFLNARLEPGDVVFARSEFYFGLQCRACLRDDENLGVLSRRHADFVVIGPDYTEHLTELREKNPALYREIEQRLNSEYEEVFRNPNYQVMRRTGVVSEKR